MKRGIRSWLNVEEANPVQINISQSFDYIGNAIKNRIWYRGDGNELQQLYEQIDTGIDRYKFWACKSSPGMEIRKIHTGIPGLIVDVLTSVCLADAGEIEFENKEDEEVWRAIEQENEFMKRLEKAIKECLYIGDGAFKISYDESISEYPILEFYPGDQIEIKRERGRIREIVFKTVFYHGTKRYVLYEYYGYGYIKNELYYRENQVELDILPETKDLETVSFGGYEEEKGGTVKHKGEYMLAVPIKFYESSRWLGRGQSIFDKKVDSFDALDEAWSQWMDALRAGRTREYIPDCFLPRDPNTGKLLKANAFDNRYIKTESDMREGAVNKITLEQPSIPYDSYQTTYITALDQCLQGVISPSTLGIDMKKLDNAEAQREKEKATLYTRNSMISALEEDLSEIARIAVRAYYELTDKERKGKEIMATVDFGEYANPSFEAQVETVSKAKTGGIMSVEASVEELYGDSKNAEWKKEEVGRLKAEQGISEIEEPALNLGEVNIDDEPIS
ncbi:MAG: phage portal protein [Emergencia sp.]|nr:phage portal protein [Emergencia sp.]